MPPEWSEQPILPRSAKLTFEGIDQDAKDQLDIENFARGAKAPSAEDAGGKAFATSPGMRARAISPRDAMMASLGVGFGLIAYLVTGELGVNSQVQTGVTAAAGVLGLCLLALIDMVRSKKAAPVVRDVNDTFTLSLSPIGFSWAGAQKPPHKMDIATIASFAGDMALSVSHIDGKTTTLPCRLPRRDHAPLAARLNQVLADVKADLSQ